MSAIRTARQAHYSSPDWVTIHPIGTCPCPRPGCQNSPQPAAAPSPAPEPLELPTSPRRFRVHFPDSRTRDCTLHPDGTITTVMAGQTWRSLLTFAEMHAMGGWDQAHIEWDPADQPATEPEARPTAPTEQPSLFPQNTA